MNHNKKKTFGALLLAAAASLMLSVPAMAAKISVPQNVRWEETKACWDEAEDAYQYQIQLYKDGVKQKSTINTTSLSIEMSGYMREKGKYTFQVRVRDRISDEYGRYSAKSGAYEQEKTVTEKRSVKRTTSQNKKKQEDKEPNPGPGEAVNGWQRDSSGWWYRNKDGSYLMGGWYTIAEKWYYFDSAGYMKTGWFVADGIEYYAYPDGVRAVGWSEINGGYYYFNENGAYNPGIRK